VRVRACVRARVRRAGTGMCGHGHDSLHEGSCGPGSWDAGIADRGSAWCLFFVCSGMDAVAGVGIL
jgi:hypothetical protein